MKTNIPLLGESCPWYDLSKLAPPDVNWCEASTCGWINEPANTWSNLAYLILTIWVYKKTKNIEDKSLKAFVPAFFLMGFFSFIFHASYNFFSQWLDFVGMFLMTGLLISLNFKSMKIISKEKFNAFYLGFVALFSALVILFYLIDFPIQTTIAAQALFLIFSEFKLKKLYPNTNYKPFFISIVLILIAVTFSILDVTRTFCDPHNHFVQGHALWHLTSALSLAFAFKFYSQERI